MCLLSLGAGISGTVESYGSKKIPFISAAAQENQDTWVPDMLGLIQKYKLHWTGFSFHPAAAP